MIALIILNKQKHHNISIASKSIMSYAPNLSKLILPISLILIFGSGHKKTINETTVKQFKHFSNVTIDWISALFIWSVNSDENDIIVEKPAIKVNNVTGILDQLPGFTFFFISLYMYAMIEKIK